MNKLWALGILLLFSQKSWSHTPTTAKLDYIENRGQWESAIKFKSDLKGGWVFLEKDAFTFLFLDPEASSHPQQHIESKGTHSTEKINAHAYQMKWIGANQNVLLAPENSRTYYNNYIKGSTSASWYSNVKIWEGVRYKNLYKGIDFFVYSKGSAMKSDYIVAPNADPSQIKVLYKGVDDISLLADGKMRIKTSVNEIFEYAPLAYQMNGAEREIVPCKYVLNGQEMSFEFPKGYDIGRQLIIDPVLVFATYSSSPADNWGSSSTHDAAGNMFLGGIALEPGYPTTLGAFQTNYSGGDGFENSDVVITKFTANGTSRLYSTFLGGTSNEMLSSLYCTDNNELIALISTSSSNFPTAQNGYDRTFNGGPGQQTLFGIDYINGSDIAIVKLNSTGSALAGGTFFGGTGTDGLNVSNALRFNYGDDSRGDIAVDKQGNIYIVSVTNSTNIPGTSGKAQAAISGGYDAVVAKFSSNLNTLTWATYYGGSNNDAGYSIQLDKNDNVFIAGGTVSTNIPATANGINSTYRGGSADGFLAKISANGNSFLSATYLGTSSYDQAHIIDIDNSDNVYVFGQTLGAYPVSQNVYSNTNAKQFIHKLNSNLNSTVFSTVFGSPNSNSINISPTAFLVDVCGSMYAVGWGGVVNNSGSTFGMPVTQDAIKPQTDGSDFYLFNLAPNGTSLIYASFFGEDGGADHVDGGTSRFDKNGVVYQAVCASCGGSNEFPVTPGAYGQNNLSNNCNMAGVKFRFDLQAMQILTTTATPTSGCSPLSVSFKYTSTKPGTQFLWNFGDGTTANTEFPTHIFNAPGTYRVKFTLSNPQDCNPVDSSFVTVTVKDKLTSTIDRAICNGQQFTIGNQSFSQAGTYNVTVPGGSNGCDSVVTLNLSIKPGINTVLNRSICDGDSVKVGNQVFKTSGTFSVTFSQGGECDSTVTLNLVVNPLYNNIINRKICEGQIVTIGTQNFDQPGTYVVNLLASTTCDSTVTLNLEFADQLVTEIIDTICAGETFTIGDLTVSESGSYTVTIPVTETCDSIVNLTLTVENLPSVTASVDKSEVEPGTQVQLEASTQNEGVSFNWQPVVLVSNPSIFNPTAVVQNDTWFVVEVNTAQGCSARDSVFVDVVIVDCFDNNVFLPNAFTPNGDGKNDVYFVRSIIPLEYMSLMIYNRWGEKVFETDVQTKGWDGKYKEEKAAADTYGYIFKGKCGETIIERKGNITLVR